MISNLIKRGAFFLTRLLLKIRYRVRVKGLEHIQNKKGLLFLGNHPSELDPLFLSSYLWARFKPRFVAAEFTLYLPFIGSLVRWLNTISVPEFRDNVNSYKKKALKASLQECHKALENGENLFVFPAGQITRSGREAILGGTGVMEILDKRPDTEYVLVRIKGLRGSLFSAGIEDCPPPILGALKRAFRLCLRSFFIMPKREVEIEFYALPKPYPKERALFREQLEAWYNNTGEELLRLIPYSFWEKKKSGAKIQEKVKTPLSIPKKLEEAAYIEIASALKIAPEKLSKETHFVYDLDLDSLDRAELVTLLEEKFHVKQVAAIDLERVEDFLRFAHEGYVKGAVELVEAQKEKSFSANRKKKNRILEGKGKTILEKFLDISKRLPNQLCLADLMSGELTYRQVRQRASVLARHFRKFPEERIGVMLPASSGAFVVILALMMVHKVPVMLNWTVGERNLNNAVKTSGIQRTLTSWRFVNRLPNVSFGVVDQQFLFLEQVSRDLSFWDKINGSVFPLCGNACYGPFNEKETAVILFSSGTGAAPKAIPLSHRNLVSNIEGTFKAFTFKEGDSGISFLPPFHSFGFVSAGFFVILSGIPLYLTPNPNDLSGIEKMLKISKATLTATPPTFFINMLRGVDKEALSSLRCVLLGAEKTAPTLFERCTQRYPNMHLIEGYGVTECSPVISMNRVEEKKKGVGRPIKGVELKIVSLEDFKELPSGEKGLILAKSASIFDGYLGNEEDPFVEVDGEKWYNTGDIGSLDKEGFLTIEGREKRCVKIGGEMLSLTALECAIQEGLLKHGIESCQLCVGAIEIPGEKTRLHLLTNFKEVELKMVNQILKEEGFSTLASISKVHSMVELPLMGSGKVDFKAAKKILETVSV
jgi:long-chain-fatty-acid--[acyl-carrier-protein] ligase